jgi:tRNA (mo5U34)-methyltransferase
MKMRMRIEYPDGTVHGGNKDFRPWIEHLGLSDVDFSGLNVHDVATDEGWWAFWAESRGANYVEASDVEEFESYDWGYHPDKEFIEQHNAARGGRKVFDLHHDNLKSGVVAKKQSVYEINGKFDVIFCHGLLYHLRHPLLAIDRLRAACQGLLIMETFVDDRDDSLSSIMRFYRTHEIGPISNWTGASTACVNSWLKDSGFDHVFYCREHFPRPNRQTFVALVGDRWLELFASNKNLIHCDRGYWKKIFDATRFNDKVEYHAR